MILTNILCLAAVSTLTNTVHGFLTQQYLSFSADDPVAAWILAIELFWICWYGMEFKSGDVRVGVDTFGTIEFSLWFLGLDG